MRKLAAFVLVASVVLGAEWTRALPGYSYQFPRDHFSHPDYRMEWWYYTGNLRAENGHRFGFELTFFRQGEQITAALSKEDAIWRPDQIYFAQLALTDIDEQRFYHTERLNRAGPGLAGANLTRACVWNGNWQVKWTALPSAEQSLQAVSGQFTLTLKLHASKPAVVNGTNGVSRRGAGVGEASHYISFSRLIAQGELVRSGFAVHVQGNAWMDHEFFSDQLGPELTGWDWFSIQLDNDQELMLYRLRTKPGGTDAFSSGTYVDGTGGSHFLGASDFSVSPGRKWHSSRSGANYPVSWNISVPELDLELVETADLDSQELISDSNWFPTYWEGAVSYHGRLANRLISGVGYLEMTGYTGPLRFGE